MNIWIWFPVYITISEVIILNESASIRGVMWSDLANVGGRDEVEFEELYSKEE